MSRKFVYLYLLSVLIIFSGCERIGRLSPLSKRKIKKEEQTPYIKDLKLAESIVWPEPIEISLKRDPYRPLVGRLYFGTGVPFKEELDLELTGILFSDNPLALIKTPQEALVVRKNDKIGKAVIKEIEKDIVVLEKDGKIIILKMEEKDEEKK